MGCDVVAKRRVCMCWLHKIPHYYITAMHSVLIQYMHLYIVYTLVISCYDSLATCLYARKTYAYLVVRDTLNSGNNYTAHEWFGCWGNYILSSTLK